MDKEFYIKILVTFSQMFVSFLTLILKGIECSEGHLETPAFIEDISQTNNLWGLINSKLFDNIRASYQRILLFLQPSSTFLGGISPILLN